MGTCFACLRTTRKQTAPEAPKPTQVSTLKRISKSESRFDHADSKRQDPTPEPQPEIGSPEKSISTVQTPKYDHAELKQLESLRSELVQSPYLNNFLRRHSSSMYYRSDSSISPKHCLTKSKFFMTGRDDKESNHNSSTRHQYEEHDPEPVSANHNKFESPLNPTFKGMDKKLRNKLNHFATIYNCKSLIPTTSNASNTNTPTNGNFSLNIKSQRSSGSDQEQKQRGTSPTRFGSADRKTSLGHEADVKRFGANKTGSEAVRNAAERKVRSKLFNSTSVPKFEKASRSPNNRLDNQKSKKSSVPGTSPTNKASLAHKLKLRAASSALRSFLSRNL